MNSVRLKQHYWVKKEDTISEFGIGGLYCTMVEVYTQVQLWSIVTVINFWDKEDVYVCLVQVE